MPDTPTSAADILLYDHPLSPYAQKVRIALREKDLPFRTALPTDLGSGRNPVGFAAASPRGEVPALVHEGLAIFDSTIILQYLEDAWPERPLAPPDPAGRARARMLEEVMDTHFESITWGLGEVRYFGRAKGELAAQLEAAAGRQIEGFYAWLTAQLGDARWFAGADFGWADLMVIPYVNGAVSHGFKPDRDSPLGQWRWRANQRPSVRTTGQEAVAATGTFDKASERVSSGKVRREYRDYRLEWMVKSGGVEVVLDGLKKDNIRFAPDFG